MMRRLLRESAAALGAGLAGAFAAAGVAGWKAAAPEGYWAAGYHRLVAAEMWERFDRWGPLAAGLALVPVAVLALLRWRGLRRPRSAGSPARVGLALCLPVLGLRAVGALDVLWTGRGRPNLVLISIDTLRADRLGTYGYDLPTSPAIDRRLAAAGVTVTDVYSQSPEDHSVAHDDAHVALPGGAPGVDVGQGRTREAAQPRGAHARRGAEERGLCHRRLHRRCEHPPLARLRPGVRRLQARAGARAHPAAGSPRRTSGPSSSSSTPTPSTIPTCRRPSGSTASRRTTTGPCATRSSASVRAWTEAGRGPSTLLGKRRQGEAGGRTLRLAPL